MSIFNFSNPISQWQFQNPYLIHKQAHPEQKNSVFLILSLCVMIPVLVTIIAGISILLFIYLAVLVILKPEMVSVRWGRGFPHLPSALLNLTARTLVFSHILPTAMRIRDFHPLERAPAGRTWKTAETISGCFLWCDICYGRPLREPLFPQPAYSRISIGT